jgi:hypothetical protein
MPAETMIHCEALTKRFGYFTAVDHVSFSVGKGSIFGFLGPNGSGKSTVIRMSPIKRLNEPPEPSPGLSGAMPWGNVIRSNPRPEGAREPLGESHNAVSCLGCLKDARFSRPFRADGLFAAQSQGIALTREALGCNLMAFQATD